MAGIKSMDEIAAKWARVTPQRTEDYQEGVRNPRKSWEQATSAAADAWKEGVNQAIVAGSFKKGVSRAGNQKWQQGAIEKGVPRWGQGVQVAEPAYAAGFAPYQSALSSLKLPPRYARRDPRNLERVKAVVDAMNKVKVSQG